MSARPHFPGQRPTERAYLVARHHWIFDVAVLVRLLVTALLPLLAIPVFRLLGFRFPGEWLLLTQFLYALYLAILPVFHYRAWLNAYLDFAIITEERLLDFTQTSLVNQKIAEVPLGVIQDATGTVSGFWGTVLGYGDVLVQTAGESANFQMLHVPSPNLLASRIMAVRQNFMQKGASSAPLPMPPAGG